MSEVIGMLAGFPPFVEDRDSLQLRIADPLADEEAPPFVALWRRSR
jgi:hypothetical protein